MSRPLPPDHLDLDLAQLDLDRQRLARAAGKAAPPRTKAAPAAPRATATRGLPRWPSGEPIDLPTGLTPAQRRQHLGSLRVSSAREVALDRIERRGERR